MARGGNKTTPANPAPVSGPGKLARRTDGGAGSKTQPIRVAPGQQYGAGVASEAQQQAAPLPVANQGGSAGPVSSPGAPPLPTPGVFGATQRPGESPLAGAMSGGQAVAQDVDAFLNILYSQFPHPAIAQLLRKG